jgi:hypothetical protein
MFSHVHSETLCIHTAWISDILRKTSLSSHSDLGMSPRSCFFTSLNVHQTLVVHPSASSESLTFSNLPISSRSPDLLGVVVSTLPSASLPGHNNSRCFPLRSVLSPPSTSHQQRVYRMSQDNNTPFFAEQPENCATHRRRCARSRYIPYSKGDL